MSHEVSIVQGQFLLGVLINLWAVVQAWYCLKVAVQMFNSNKKMMNRNTAWLLQYVVDVILEGLTCIMLEHLLEVKHDTLQKEEPQVLVRVLA